MKKISLIILCFMFFLTGCSVRYDLTIDSRNMTEVINFTLPNTEENLNKVNDLNKNNISSYFDIDANKSRYYESNLDILDDEINLNYTYTYSGDNLKKSQFINYCFYKKNVIKNDDYVIIETKDGIMCKYQDGEEQFEKLVVNIKTDLKVLENNADSVSKGTYTWIFDDGNYSDKEIYIKIKYNELANQQIKNIFNGSILVIFGIIVCIGVVIVISLILQKQKNNKV